ncbi:uncharacterized protein [Ptychodera flava]
MQHLGRYVPSKDGKPVYSVICHGDQLSIERMVDAKFAMASSRDHINRLKGLEPRPQEFHKRCITMQDTMNKLFSGQSASDRGSLFNIKVKFGHRAVKKKVMDDVNHTVDFMNFFTEGYTCLLAMKLRNLESLSSVPSDFGQQHPEEYLKRLSEEMVAFIWPEIDDVPLIDSELVHCLDEYSVEQQEYCICGEDPNGAAGTMIECSALSQCRSGRWYHVDCIGLDIDGISDDDWFCSPECEKSSIFCFCKTQKDDEEWIGCSRKFWCPNGEWFHQSCVGVTECPEGDWFCSEECELAGSPTHAEEEADYICQYTCHVLWRGLFHMAERDAERENDGPAMLSHWKISMLDFYMNNHFKYLIAGHRLIACINGYLPARQAEEMLWNATANLKGGAGKNIPLDLLNEFLNNDFKQNLKHSQGRYTDSQVSRCSQLVGRLSADIEHVYMTQVMDEYISKSKTTRADHRKDVGRFVREYKKDKLFNTIPGRCHSGFDQFQNRIYVKNSQNLILRLKKHSRTMDVMRGIHPND